MGRNDEPTCVRLRDKIGGGRRRPGPNAESRDGWQVARDIGKRTWEGRRGEEAHSLARLRHSLPPPSASGHITLLSRTDGARCMHSASLARRMSSILLSDFKTSREAREASVRSGMRAALCKERSERPSTLYAKSFRPNSSTPRPSRASQCNGAVILRPNGTCLVENVSRCN